MAYSTSNPPALVGQTIHGNGIWHYSSTDVHTDVDAADYFANGDALGMQVGDVVFVIETDNSYAQTTHSVTAVTAGGAATVSAAT
jgi:lipid-binding SYLF domain-containing protein